MAKRRWIIVLTSAITVSFFAVGPSPAKAAPTIGSFTATLLTAPDKVRLQWTTTNASQVYIFGSSTENGFGRIGFTPVNGSVDVVTGWGSRTFRLAAKDAAGVWRYRTISSPSLSPPANVTITSTNPKTINYFRSPNINSPLPNHTITWNKNGASVVKMRRCLPGGSCVNLPDTTGTSYVVTGSDAVAPDTDNSSLATVNSDGSFSGALAPSGQGEVRYELQACTTRPDSTLYCGESVKAFVHVAPSHITSTPRVYKALPASNFALSWDANGANWWSVDAPTLGVNNQLGSSPFTFTAAQLDAAGAGLHTVKVKSCSWYGGSSFDCAHEHRAKSPGGGVSNLITSGTAVTAGVTRLATVNGTDVYSPRSGKVTSTCGCGGQSPAAGTVLAVVETNDVSLMQLNLGPQTWTTKAWTQDFSSANSTHIQINKVQEVRPPGYSTVNGTTILPNGDIYSLGEYHSAAAYTPGTGTSPEARMLPLHHKLNNSCSTEVSPPCYFDPVLPYGANWTNKQSSQSNSQDTFLDSSGKIWSSEGWAGGRAERQQVTVDATAGNWRLTYSGQQTTNIDSEATAATVQTRLEALSNLAPDDVAVTGNNGGPYTVTFQGPLEGRDVPQMSAQNISLTGGTATVSVSTSVTALYNHSRIYRHDPTATDSATTLQDDRFCSYNVPGDQNDVMGLTHAGGKTWFIESRWGSAKAALTWFTPTDSQFTNCAAQNAFDYGTEDKPVANPPTFSPDYCVPPNTTNCFSTVTLPTAVDSPAHLAYDPTENAIWMATYLGSTPSLSHYDIATGAFTSYPLPHSVNPWQSAVGLNGQSSGIWKMEVAGDFVYLSDLTDGDVIRFDKLSWWRSSGYCTGLIYGLNACMSEVHLPASAAWQTHVRGSKLYFTTAANSINKLANDKSLFGYIDLNNWGAITTYTGLETLVAAGRAAVNRPVHSWFDVDPVSGKVAIGMHSHSQYLRLACSANCP